MRRERDRLGRPLPAGVAGEPGIASLPRDNDATVWAEATAYLRAGRPFHAHEVFEERWRNCPVQFREVWRALAQWAAAETHAARGNDAGARALAERALTVLSNGSSPDPAVDLRVACERCQQLLAPGDGIKNPSNEDDTIR